MVAVVMSPDPVVAPACADELRADGAAVEVVATGAEVTDLLAAGTPVEVLVAGPVPASDPGGFADDVVAVLEQVVPPMVERGAGRIVLVVSATGLPGSTWTDGSGAAAWGLVGVARTAARELAASGITVNVVRTGLIDVGAGEPDADVVRDTPLRRAGTPADVAGAVAFLASADAGYITGTVLPVDGGLAMGQGA